MEIVSLILIIIGAVFYLLGGLGNLRMPDVFNRIQAGTKATTLGSFSMLLGVGVSHPEWLIKIGLIIVFIAISNPIGSSALAKAAYLTNQSSLNVVQDDMSDLIRGEEDVK